MSESGVGIPYWFSVAEPYFAHIDEKKSLRILQIGVFSGDATEWLLKNRTVERIDDVDTWAGGPDHNGSGIDFAEVERIYDKRLGKDNRVTKHKTTSDEFFASNRSTYNFIYIDGDHTALQTALDALNSWRVLEVGGVLAFDDYQWGAPGMDRSQMPKDGIDAFLHIIQGQYSIVLLGYQAWVRKER